MKTKAAYSATFIRKILNIFLFIFFINQNISAQDYYFPSNNGSQWDTVSPARLGWCPSRIDSMYNYLQQTNTKAFIVLHRGKIVLEKYFGNHNADSLWYWASAGKTITAFLAGMAQQQGQIQLNQTVSHYLGNGWTVAPQNKESLITVKQLLNMTSGLNDEPPAPCNSLSTPKACLQYLADAGTRWGYHTGAYLQMHHVFETVSNQGISLYTKNTLGDRIGMGGFWINGVYISNARSMARFGLLNLARGSWGADTLMTDTAYYRQMITATQPYNLSYGYLWWLNGKPSYMVPGVQFVFNAPFITNAPPDMFAALGLNDQKIYVVPSRDMVVIRMGNSAYNQSAALSKYDDTLWQKINQLPSLPCTYTFSGNGLFSNAMLWKHNLPPTSPLSANNTILINGECTLDKPFNLNNGGRLEVSAGAKFWVGDLMLE